MKEAILKSERRPPVHLPGKPWKTKTRDGYPVVAAYADEGPGPWIADLSNCARWDIQGLDLNAAVPSGVSVPGAPGRVALHARGLIGCSGQRQAFLWLFDDQAVAVDATRCTDVTEGTLCLALLGRDVFHITEKLTSLDLAGPSRSAPFLLLGPFAHITCQIVVLSSDPQRGAVLVSCSRGFAHDMVHALLSAGEEYGMRPAGENRFKEFFNPSEGGHRWI